MRCLSLENSSKVATGSGRSQAAVPLVFHQLIRYGRHLDLNRHLPDSRRSAQSLVPAPRTIARFTGAADHPLKPKIFLLACATIIGIPWLQPGATNSALTR